MTISRRHLLRASAALPLLGGAARAADKVSLRLGDGPGYRLPADYMGLGFEASSVAMPGLLSGSNTAYVQLVRNLGAKGVIRIGGNVSDFSTYDANGVAAFQPKATTLTQASLRQLRTFLDATGWRLIWGLNLGADALENAVTQARAVADIFGDRLIALQIGNEPDLFTRSGHRKPPYDYAAWHAEYRRTKTAIRAVLPGIPFAGPDAAFNIDWVEQFSRDEAGDAVLLTAHHYIAGQADPRTSIDFMLQEDRGFQPGMMRLQAAAKAARLPYRLCETASFSGGGRAEVSDTFASALWALDYLFVLASHGCAGVNMETGVNHLGWISKYTPIDDDLAGHYGAAAEYYGLLAFAQVSNGELIEVKRDAGGINLTAYAVRRGGGETVLTVINKDAARDAAVEISALWRLRQAQVMRLAAPSLSAKSGITLAGASVSADGAWQGLAPENIPVSGNKTHLAVTAGSAALITLRA